jgi:formamidopyrimidine-DNA glycosylase
MRKFAKVTIMKTSELEKSPHIKTLGPEPLDKNFQFREFKSQILKRPKSKIKQVLLDQNLIAGIGNIYSDEILWSSDIHPLSLTSRIPEKNFLKMFKIMKEILKQGIELGGDSTSDYRNIEGEKGNFQNKHKVYRRTGQPCPKKKCSGVIKRLVVGARSAHFCPAHQELFGDH